MAVTWTKELFDQAWSVLGEPEGHPNTRQGIRLHYCRAGVYPMMQIRARMLAETLAFTRGDRILIIGCGFGWTVEALGELGYTAVGTDISGYIHDAKDVPEEDDIKAAIRAVGLDDTRGKGLEKLNQFKGDGVRTRAIVLNEDSVSDKSRENVKAVLGRAPTVIITEDVMPSLTDEEGLALHAELVKYNSNARIVHFLQELEVRNVGAPIGSLQAQAIPLPPFNPNSKFLADWKLLYPDATIIADGYPFRVA